MAERTPRLNTPISDEALYASGLSRDLPQREPMPAPPTVMPDDLNPTTPGIEYRAMTGILSVPPEQRADSPPSNGASQSAFGWLIRRRPMPS